MSTKKLERLQRTALEYCEFCFAWHQIKYYHIDEENRDYTKCSNCESMHDLTRQAEICKALLTSRGTSN